MNVRQEDDSVLMAVYGTLREGQGNWAWCLNNEHCELLGTIKTPPVYTMISLGGFPGVLLNGEIEVTVEIFRVRSKNVERDLDRLEGYPNFYNKEVIETPWGQANMYVLLNERYSSRDVISHGDWVKYLEEREASYNKKVATNVSEDI